MHLLEAQHITSGYGKKQVLDDVSVTIDAGEIVLLIGSNGSGKSTLLKALYGQVKPWNSEARLTFDGQDILSWPSHKLLGKGLVYVPQKNNVFVDMTVHENLQVSGLSIKDKARLNEGLELVYSQFPKLVAIKNRTPFNLSGGERQMLALAMGLLHQPKLMLLDEPTAGLAPALVAAFLQQIKQLNETLGITILMVEHRVKESLTIANRVVGLKLGRVATIEYSQATNLDKLHEIFT